MKKAVRKTSSPKKKKLAEKFQVDVSADKIWRKAKFDAASLAGKIVPLALNAAKHSPPAEISILLTTDAAIRQLNKKYRSKDKPTNVLSFPLDERTLGDIVIAYETMSAEAEAMQMSVKDHFTHLLIHGTLHLLGYDHEEKAAAKTMEKLEISILSTLGIENPYSNPNFLA